MQYKTHKHLFITPKMATVERRTSFICLSTVMGYNFCSEKNYPQRGFEPKPHLCLPMGPRAMAPRPLCSNCDNSTSMNNNVILKECVNY